MDDEDRDTDRVPGTSPSDAPDPTMSLDDRSRHGVRRAPKWGRLEIASPPRWGWNAYQLTVYPPGISVGDRRLLWFDDWAPLLGAIAGALAFAACSFFLAPAWFLALVPAGLVAAKVVSHRLSADLRRSVRSISVSYAHVADGVRAYGDSASLERLVGELNIMDHAIVGHEIDEKEYLRRWGAVYESLPRCAAVKRATSRRASTSRARERALG